VNFQAFSFWNFAKANVVMLTAGFVFSPLNVFANTVSYNKQYSSCYLLEGMVRY
jgi:hypothetical protein